MDNTTNSSLVRASALISEAANILQEFSNNQQLNGVTADSSNRSAFITSPSATLNSPSSSSTFQAQNTVTSTLRQPTLTRLRYFTDCTDEAARHAPLGLETNRNLDARPPRPTPAATVVSEMRNSFAPYTRTPQRRSTGSGRSNLGSNRRRFHDTSFARPFMCLGGPSDVVTPNANRKSLLLASGLGQSMITMNRSFTGDEMERAFRSEFPGLGNCGFEVMRAVGSGQGKPFERLSRSQAIPTVEMIYSTRTGTIYIRPLSDLIAADLDAPAPDESATESIPASSIPGAETTPNVNTPAPVSLQTSASSIPAIALELEGMEDSDDEILEVSSPVVHDMTTIEEFRQYIVRNSPGFQFIMIDRNMLLEGMIGAYLKDPTFNFQQQTKVFFMNEPGRDVNALSKEYFTLGINTLREAKFYGSHALLEVEVDHLLPTRDPLLKSSQYYEFLGKFMGHAAAHFGMAFIGFSSAAVRYIFNNCEASDLTLGILDIPDLDARQIMTKITQWAEGIEPDNEDKERIGYWLNDCNIYDQPCRSNLRLLEQQFIEWHVITSRATFLDEIRKGLKAAGVFEFIKEREYLWSTIFPSESALNYCAADILQVVTYDFDGDFPVLIKETFETFLNELDSKQIRNLLQSWTGSPSLPSQGLEIKVVEDGIFIIHACFTQIEIPRGMPQNELKLYLTTAIQHGVYGFGSV